MPVDEGVGVYGELESFGCTGEGYAGSGGVFTVGGSSDSEGGVEWEVGEE